MKRFIKTVFIVGLCGVGAIALAHAVLGKHRTQNAARALQNMAQQSVDELIAAQQDLKEELGNLRDEYPRQIAMLRSQIKQVDREVTALDKEETRAADIVRLCEEDISYLEDQRDVVGNVYTEARVIEHRGSRYNADEAELLVERISRTREMYRTRKQDISEQRAILQTEKDQLSLELESIRDEQQEFEAEYQSLLREIERLKRNEKMIKLAESRRGIGASRHGEAMTTLAQVKTAVERASIEQEERLKAARVAPRSLDYETRARLLELRRKREARRHTESTPEAVEAATTEEDATEIDAEVTDD